MQEFFANGKLLLSGEYVVLDGAKAIGLPTQLGQKLWIEEIECPKPRIFWEALLYDKSQWFTTEIDTNNFSYGNYSDENLAQRISHILEKIDELKPNSILNKSFNIKTQLEFPQDWGLGSSSTLIALLSKYFEVNPYDLLAATFGGSGYDVSCAMMPRPQSFQLGKKDRKIQFVEINANITPHIYFVYLNQKQNSREGIQLYKSLPKNERLIKSITDISEEIIKCDDLYDFEDLIHVHERLLSNHLGIVTIKESLFSDYRGGEIKSLGAWGGDFVMVTSESGDMQYFEDKGYQVIFNYDNLIV